MARERKKQGIVTGEHGDRFLPCLTSKTWFSWDSPCGASRLTSSFVNTGIQSDHDGPWGSMQKAQYQRPRGPVSRLYSILHSRGWYDQGLCSQHTAGDQSLCVHREWCECFETNTWECWSFLGIKKNPTNCQQKGFIFIFIWDWFDKLVVTI